MRIVHIITPLRYQQPELLSVPVQVQVPVPVQVSVQVPVQLLVPERTSVSAVRPVRVSTTVYILRLSLWHSVPCMSEAW